MRINGSLKINTKFDKSNDVTIIHDDRLTLLEQIKDSKENAQLIITSPPYNLGKSYEKQTSLETYIQDQKITIKACVDILADTGSICWQVGHYIQGTGAKKEAFPLDLVLYPIFKEFDLVLKNRIVWHFGHGLHEKHRFSGRHETILWFTKETKNYKFNLDNVRIPQKYPGKRSYQGTNKGKLSGNPLGKNPSDVWLIPNVKANHIEKTEHDCQFPIALVQKLILALSNEGDLVVDPYLGVGSTAVASIIENRRIAGADIEKRFLSIAKKRIRKAHKGTLKIRPLNKPIHLPDPNTSVAAIPKEWKTLK